MRKNKCVRKILAIDPGTRNLGIAFFDRSDLIYHGVKIIKQRKSPQETFKEGKQVILRMIHDFKPEMLVVEKTFFYKNKNSTLLNRFVNEIQSIGKRNGLCVRAYAANSVRKRICGNGTASKDEVAKVVISYYPELKPYLTSNRRWKETFYRNMFDAVAVGLIVVLRD